MENKTIIAAVLVIVFLVGILFFTNRPVDNSRVAATTPTSATGSKLTALQTQTTTQGTGTRTVQTGDKLSVQYIGKLADGTTFDKSTSPFTFTVGQGVIEGWSQGVVGMKKGEVRDLSIPANLGYGAQSAGSIPANSDLYFQVTLVDFLN